MPGVRVGLGYDSHRFAPGGPLRLGGIDIPGSVHCVGHSDADAVCHALTDAILGAAALGDIGTLFPDTDEANRGRDSIDMLQLALERVQQHGWTVVNVDVTVVTQIPRVAPHRDQMRERIAAALGVDVGSVSIKGKTNEMLGWIGREEGLAVMAVAMLEHR